MDLKGTSNKLSKIKLDEETKEAILGLVDDKINNDMENAVSRIEASIDKLDHKLETSIGSLKGESRITYWVVGIAFLAITCLLTIIAFKK